MVCQRCAALPVALRRHPAPNRVLKATGSTALADLVCERCGASCGLPDSTGLLLETLIRLDRVGFGAETPPLLRAGTGVTANV